VRVWDPHDASTTIAAYPDDTAAVHAACAFELDGRPVIAFVDASGTLRVWDPHDTDTTIAVYTGHYGFDHAVCAFELDGRPAIAYAADADGKVRVNPSDRAPIPVYARVAGLAASAQQLIIGLDVGVIVLTLDTLTDSTNQRS
jgi:hypothetical protein